MVSTDDPRKACLFLIMHKILEIQERDLEKIITESPKEKLKERGLIIEEKIFTQIKIGNYGIADIVTAKRIENIEDQQCLIITIYELKKDQINFSTFEQALRYAKGIDSYLKFRNFEFDYRINIKLIGKTIDKNSFCFLPEWINSNVFYDLSELYIYEYKIDGIHIERIEDFSLLKDEGFKK